MDATKRAVVVVVFVSEQVSVRMDENENGLRRDGTGPLGETERAGEAHGAAHVRPQWCTVRTGTTCVIVLHVRIGDGVYYNLSEIEDHGYLIQKQPAYVVHERQVVERWRRDVNGVRV